MAASDFSVLDNVTLLLEDHGTMAGITVATLEFPKHRPERVNRLPSFS
jgi:hypothetical protein